jgi:hypothetical protein
MLQGVEYSGSIPRYELGHLTFIHDEDEDRIVTHLNGVVALPIGACVELVKPNRDVYVVGVRLLAPNPEGDNAAYLCLDVSKNKPE